MPDKPGRGVESTARLIERARTGDAHALEILFARYLPILRRWASGRLPRWARNIADTQDLVQETVLQTLKRIDTFEVRHEGALQAYLRQAVMNRIRDELRKFERRGVNDPLESGIPDDSPSPLEHAIGRQATERYEKALSQLKTEDREAIVARIEMGYTWDEMAEVLGKPTAGAARKTAERALVKLIAEMKREE